MMKIIPGWRTRLAKTVRDLPEGEGKRRLKPPTREQVVATLKKMKKNRAG